MKKRIWYWDVLRIAAMVFLVIRHSATATFEFVPTLGSDWWVCNVYGSLSAWMVPVFLMISGASFLEPQRTVTLERLYGKNIRHLLTVFVFWSAFYAVYNILVGQTNGKNFWEMFLEGHFHLWFLPMIIGIYMLVPLLREGAVSPLRLRWMLAATALFGVVIPTLQDLDLFFDASLVNVSYSFGMFSSYVCFFYLGYYLHNTFLSKKQRMGLYLIGILATAIVFVGTWYLTVRDGVHNEDIQSDNNLFTCLQGVAIFVWSREFFEKRSPKESTCRFLWELSELTFGVYMVHVLFLALLDRFGFSPVNYPAWYMIPLLIGFVLPTSFFVSLLIRRLPVIGKKIT